MFVCFGHQLPPTILLQSTQILKENVFFFLTEVSYPQVPIRWLLQKPNVPSVVIGPRTIEHLNDLMGAGNGWQLSQDEVGGRGE